MKTMKQDMTDDPMINIQLLGESTVSEEAKKQLLELQLRMATCSINHEYARMEFEGMDDRERREELLDYMNECRVTYFEARSTLSSYNPYALAEFEADLMRQKQMSLGGLHA